MGASVVMTPDGPMCSNCEWDLSEGLEVLAVAERHVNAEVDEDGRIAIAGDPCAEASFEWEIAEACCPGCGHQLGGTRRSS